MATLLTPFNIILGIIFLSLLIFIVTKNSTSSLGNGAKKIKYVFWPFIFFWKKPWKMLGLLVLGVGYGIYLIVLNNLPTLEEKIFSELSKNLAEVELQSEKEKLATLNAKVKSGGKLTEEEKVAAMSASKKIEKVRKDYSRGKLLALVPPPPVAMKTLPQITRQITDDLRNSAYLSWKKPAGYGGATCKKQVVAIVKIDRLDENFLVFSNTEKKFSSTCNWKTAGFYQGSWRQGNKQGLIKLTPEYKNGEITSFCGAVGEGTNNPNVPCWVTATMPK